MARLHTLLPMQIDFIIVSGDKGFIEIVDQLKDSSRSIRWFDPHAISLDDLIESFPSLDVDLDETISAQGRRSASRLDIELIDKDRRRTFAPQL